MEIVLQKQRSRIFRGINYYRYRVTIPARIVCLLGFEGGEILDVSADRKKIIIRRRRRYKPVRKHAKS